MWLNHFILVELESLCNARNAQIANVSSTLKCPWKEARIKTVVMYIEAIIL